MKTSDSKDTKTGAKSASADKKTTTKSTGAKKHIKREYF